MGKLISQLQAISLGNISDGDIIPITDIENGVTRKITINQISDFVIDKWGEISDNPFSSNAPPNTLNSFNGNFNLDNGNYIVWDNVLAIPDLGIRFYQEEFQINDYSSNANIFSFNKNGIMKFKQFADSLPETPIGGELVYTTEGFYVAQ